MYQHPENTDQGSVLVNDANSMSPGAPVNNVRWNDSY